jgi:hypothetical protein
MGSDSIDIPIESDPIESESDPIESVTPIESEMGDPPFPMG